jgi:hypothetical protein
MKFQIVFLGLLLGVMACGKEEAPTPPADAQLELRFQTHFDNAPLVFGNQWYTLASGEQVRFARIKFLLSGIRMVAADSTEVLGKVPYAYFDATTNLLQAKVPFAPTQQKFVGVKWEVGVDSAANHMDPNMIPVNHPLYPINNQLHWGWADGFVFVLIEGFYVKNGDDTPFIFHIGLRDPLFTGNFGFDVPQDLSVPLHFEINVADVFRSPRIYEIAENGDFTHSGEDGGVATWLYESFSKSIKKLP